MIYIDSKIFDIFSIQRIQNPGVRSQNEKTVLPVLIAAQSIRLTNLLFSILSRFGRISVRDNFSD